MSAFADALGQLAQDYGNAGIIKQRQDMLQNEMAMRAAHENLYNALAQKASTQQQQMIDLAQRKAATPLWLGQPYTSGGKRFIDYWDTHAGKPGHLQLGDEENPVDAWTRQFTTTMGRPPDADEKAAAVFHQFGITPPKQDKPTIDYELKQDRTGRWMYVPKTPGGKSIPSDVVGKLAETQQPPVPPADTNQPLSNPLDDRYAQALGKNQLTLDQVKKIYSGKELQARLPAVIDRGRNLGLNTNEQMSAAGQNIVMNTQPVLEQAQRMMKDIENLKLTDNNTPGYLAAARAKYAIGIASPEGTLAHDIAGLSLGSVIEAASALKGSSRALPALQKAMEHTPNVWVDSPKQLYSKLQEITGRLSDMVNDAKRFGTKSGLQNQNVGGGPKVNIAPDGSISISTTP